MQNFFALLKIMSKINIMFNGALSGWKNYVKDSLIDFPGRP